MQDRNYWLARLVRGGIIAYAIAGCYSKLQRAEMAAAWQAKFDAVRRTIRDWPEDLGASQRPEVAVPASIEPDDDDGGACWQAPKVW